MEAFGVELVLLRDTCEYCNVDLHSSFHTEGLQDCNTQAPKCVSSSTGNLCRKPLPRASLVSRWAQTNVSWDILSGERGTSASKGKDFSLTSRMFSHVGQVAHAWQRTLSSFAKGNEGNI